MSGKGAKGLSGKGAKGTMGDKGKAGDKKKPVSRSARAGLQFPVGRIHRLLKVTYSSARLFTADTPPVRLKLDAHNDVIYQHLRGAAGTCVSQRSCRSYLCRVQRSHSG